MLSGICPSISVATPLLMGHEEQDPLRPLPSVSYSVRVYERGKSVWDGLCTAHNNKSLPRVTLRAVVETFLPCNRCVVCTDSPVVFSLYCRSREVPPFFQEALGSPVPDSLRIRGVVEPPNRPTRRQALNYE